jgi:urease accessory protein
MLKENATVPRVDAALDLRFDAADANAPTRMTVREQTPPLRVIRAFGAADGRALVHLHNLSGGVLGGDRLTLRAEVGPAARVQLTTTSATRIYRSREGHPP